MFCLFVTSVAFLNYTNNRFDQLTCAIMGLVCSGFHLEEISSQLGVCNVGKLSSVYCCVTNYSKISWHNPTVIFSS